MIHCDAPFRAVCQKLNFDSVAAGMSVLATFARPGSRAASCPESQPRGSSRIRNCRRLQTTHDLYRHIATLNREQRREVHAQLVPKQLVPKQLIQKQLVQTQLVQKQLVQKLPLFQTLLLPHPPPLSTRPLLLLFSPSPPPIVRLSHLLLERAELSANSGRDRALCVALCDRALCVALGCRALPFLTKVCS